jgi:uncharacterized membrane protein HdeD (DUF308 family)
MRVTDTVGGSLAGGKERQMSSETMYGPPDRPEYAGRRPTGAGQPAHPVSWEQTRTALVMLGGASVLLGALILLWPDATVTVVAVLFGLQLLFNGVVRLVQSLAVDDARAGTRVLLALLGLLSIVVGVLCLRDPLQTVALLALLLGLFWLIAGLIEVSNAMTDRTSGHTVTGLLGVLSILAGLTVLAWPRPTLLVLTVLLGIWILVFGIVMIVTGLRMGARAEERDAR